MKTFKIWLENKQNNIKDTVLQLLGLDEDGLETPLESLDTKELYRKLIPLGIWRTMPSETQTVLITIIVKKIGTVGQLIDKMSSDSDTIESPAVMPPAQEM